LLILQTAVLVPLLVGSIVIWLGLARPPDYWWADTAAASFVFIELAYMSLYNLPSKERPQSTS